MSKYRITLKKIIEQKATVEVEAPDKRTALFNAAGSATDAKWEPVSQTVSVTDVTKNESVAA